MQTLRDTLKQAQENRVAIGHFNVAELVLLKAVLRAAHERELCRSTLESYTQYKFIWANPEKC
jgi:fructose/tagatose bisphosphate aldolase